jgi:hypothetical protein
LGNKRHPHQAVAGVPRVLVFPSDEQRARELLQSSSG